MARFQETRQGKEGSKYWVHYRQIITVSNWSFIQLRTSGESVGHSSLGVASSEGGRLSTVSRDKDFTLPLACPVNGQAWFPLTEKVLRKTVITAYSEKQSACRG